MKKETVIPKHVRDFKKSMQELVDKPGSGFTSITMSSPGMGEVIIAQKTSKMANTETLNLKCDLTNEELLDISKEMSEHLNKRSQAEDSLASFSAQKKAEIKGHDAHINRSAQLINSGFEYREVKCEVVIDEKKDTVSWIRQDTGEVYNTEHPIPQRYLQKKLDLE